MAAYHRVEMTAVVQHRPSYPHYQLKMEALPVRRHCQPLQDLVVLDHRNPLALLGDHPSPLLQRQRRRQHQHPVVAAAVVVVVASTSALVAEAAAVQHLGAQTAAVVAANKLQTFYWLQPSSSASEFSPVFPQF